MMKVLNGKFGSVMAGLAGVLALFFVVSAVAMLPTPVSAQTCVDWGAPSFFCDATPTKNVCGTKPDYSCYGGAVEGCAANQLFNCSSCSCSCDTGTYMCPGCTLASPLQGQDCAPPTGGKYSQCGVCQCPSGKSLCSSSNTCVTTINCTGPGEVFDACSNSCSAPYIFRSPSIQQNGFINVSGDIASSGMIVAGYPTAPTVAAPNQNLYYGNMSLVSDGNLLLLQTGGADKFKVDATGTMQSGRIPWERLITFPKCLVPTQYVVGWNADGTVICEEIPPAAANRFLSNLMVGEVAVNDSLTPQSSLFNLGSDLLNWGNLYLDGTAFVRTQVNTPKIWSDAAITIQTPDNASINDIVMLTKDAERLRILEDGNVGIGTAAPAEKLEINDTAAGTARLRVTDTAQNPEIQLQYGAGADNHWSFYVTNGASKDLRLWGPSGGSDRLTVMAGGNVGIGTTTPGAKLSVVGGSGIEPTVNSVPTLVKFGSPSGTIPWAVRQNAAEATTPSLLWFETSNGNLGGVSAISGAVVLNGAAGKGVGLAVNGALTPSLYVASAGNVGIGTGTPNKRLHIYDTVSNAEIDIQSIAGANRQWGIYHDSGTDELRFWNDAVPTNSKHALTLGSDGKVKLAVLQVTEGAAANYILTSDASGNASWKAAAGVVDSCKLESFVGVTVSTFQGNIGGYPAADAKCVAAGFAGSHVCSVEEILRGLRCANAVLAGIANNTNFWLNGGPPGFTAQANDCGGWMLNSGVGIYGRKWKTDNVNGGYGSLTTCNQTLPFGCCK